MKWDKRFITCLIFTILVNCILANNILDSENKIYNLLPEEIKTLLHDSLFEYEIPELMMFSDEWKSYENITNPMYISADFNGDNKIDYAIIFLSKNLKDVIVCAFISTHKSYLINKLGTYTLANGLIDVFISIEKKGYWRSPTKKCYIKNDGISFIWSSASLMYSYYWKKKRFIKFMYD